MGILFILYLHLINLKVTNSGLIYGIDLKGVLLTNFSPTHDPLNVRPIDRQIEFSFPRGHMMRPLVSSFLGFFLQHLYEGLLLYHNCYIIRKKITSFYYHDLSAFQKACYFENCDLLAIWGIMPIINNMVTLFRYSVLII